MTWDLPEVLTRTDSMQLLAQGFKEIVQGEYLFDGHALKQFDSTALAIFLAWKRKAKELGKNELIFQNLPEKLIGLSQVYGIAELLK